MPCIDKGSEFILIRARAPNNETKSIEEYEWLEIQLPLCILVSFSAW